MEEKRNINERVLAIPTNKVLDRSVFAKCKEIMADLKRRIDNPSENSKLYDLLFLKGGQIFNSIRIFPGYDITIAFKSVDNMGASLGSTGLFSNKSICIEIGLFSSTSFTDPLKNLVSNLRKPRSEIVIYKDEYLSTLIHEMTHVMQFLDVAICYLKMKNIPINKNTLGDIMVVLFSRNSSFRDIEHLIGGLIPYIEYLKSPQELGANAHELIDFLIANEGIGAIEDIVSCVDKGNPSFKEIDNFLQKITQGRLGGWADIDDLIKEEMKSGLISKEELTEGYKIKKLLLKVISEFYKRHYR